MISVKYFLILSLFTFLSGCITQESRLESMLERQIGKARIMEKARLEFDSMLGKNDSELKNSILELVSDHTSITYTEVLIDGKRARIKVLAVVPRIDELTSIILLAGFLPREKMLEMTIQDLIVEISNKTRKPASEAVRSEKYEFHVDFEKQKNWMANPDQISNAFAKRNLITSR